MGVLPGVLLVYTGAYYMRRQSTWRKCEPLWQGPPTLGMRSIGRSWGSHRALACPALLSYRGLPAAAKAGVTGIHRASCSGAWGWLDTGDKPRYDNYRRSWARRSAAARALSAGGSGVLRGGGAALVGRAGGGLA